MFSNHMHVFDMLILIYIIDCGPHRHPSMCLHVRCMFLNIFNKTYDIHLYWYVPWLYVGSNAMMLWLLMVFMYDEYSFKISCGQQQTIAIRWTWTHVQHHNLLHMRYRIVPHWNLNWRYSFIRFDYFNRYIYHYRHFWLHTKNNMCYKCVLCIIGYERKLSHEKNTHTHTLRYNNIFNHEHKKNPQQTQRLYCRNQFYELVWKICINHILFKTNENVQTHVWISS